MNSSDMKIKADEYKMRLDVLVGERQEVERQLIILEEQYKQYKNKIEESFQTSDLEELKKIASQYMQNIEELELKLKGDQNV